MGWLLGFGIPITWLMLGMPLARNIYVNNYEIPKAGVPRHYYDCFNSCYSAISHQAKCLGSSNPGMLNPFSRNWAVVGYIVAGPLGILGHYIWVWGRWYFMKPINKKKKAKKKAQQEIDSLTEIINSGIGDLKDFDILKAARDGLKKSIKDM